MDTYGVQAQILYPNVAVFDAKSIVGMGDTALQLACIEAYNDFLVDFGNEQPGRFIAVSGLPFWDLTATLAEIERCAANGHKGIVFTQDPSYFGLPQLTDRYWDPMWASAAGEGSSGQLPHRLGRPRPVRPRSPRQRRPRQLRGDGGVVLHGQRPHRRPAHHGRHLPSLPRTELRVRRERHRVDPLRPRGARLAVAQLRRAQGAPGVRPAARASTSAARSTAASGSSAIRRWRRWTRSAPTTSSTRPTSRTPRACRPGPASDAQRPDEYLREVFSGVDDASLHKILHDNAARIYHLD